MKKEPRKPGNQKPGKSGGELENQETRKPGTRKPGNLEPGKRGEELENQETRKPGTRKGKRETRNQEIRSQEREGRN